MPGQPPTYDDVQNKAVVFLTLGAFGYTGAAEVGGRTDRWMTEVLAPSVGLGEGFKVLEDAATVEFQTPALQQATLAMVGAGWDPQSDGSLVPFYVVISN